MTADLAAFALANATLVAAGHGVLRLAGVRPATRDLAWSLAVAYVAGAAAVGVLGSAALVLGASLSRAQLIAGCLALWIAGLLRRRGLRIPRHVRLDRLSRLALAAAYIALAVVAIDLVVQPIWSDDAWSIWAAKANSIVLFDGLDPEFLASDSVVSASYPLVVPVLEVVALRFCGSENELVVLQLGLLFVALPGALVAVLRDRAQPLVLAVVALGLALAPSLQVQTASAVADVPLAVFFALAGTTGWRWLELGEKEMLSFTGVFAAAAVGTKVEGSLLVLFLFVALAWFAARRERSLRQLALAAAFVAATALPWTLWSRTHSLNNAFAEAGGVSSVDILGVVDRIPRAAGAMLRELADPTSWLALLALAALGVVLALRHNSGRDAAVYTIFVTLSSLLALVAVYWVTPLDFDYHVATSVRRVVTPPAVFAAAMAPLLLTRAGEAQPPR